MKKIRIKMLEDAKGSQDGKTVDVFLTDEILDVEESLAKGFIKQKTLKKEYRQVL